MRGVSLKDFIVLLAIVSANPASLKQELDTLVCRVLDRLNMQTGMAQLPFACPSSITPMNALL
jgi:hypothetical protein